MTAPAGPAGAPSTGLDARLASALAYLAGWVTGVLFLAIERRDAGVRFHAAQSVVVFGALSAVMALTVAGALLAALVSPPAFRLLMAAANLTWLAGALLWVWLLVQAGRGVRWRVPGTARLVDRLAGRG
ncbi:MAG: DUF4870 domain-containing protein [Vicinamibacterales bacterium]